MKIAVLAVQGAFIEHEKKLEVLGAECFELRQKKDLDTGFDGLVLPGGESTVQGKLLRELDMFDTLKEKNRERHAGPRYLCRTHPSGRISSPMMDMCILAHFRFGASQCLRKTAGKFPYRAGICRNREGSHDVHPCSLYRRSKSRCAGAG